MEMGPVDGWDIFWKKKSPKKVGVLLLMCLCRGNGKLDVPQKMG